MHFVRWVDAISGDNTSKERMEFPTREASKAYADDWNRFNQDKTWKAMTAVAESTCQRCKGSGMIEAQLMNPGSGAYSWHIFGCEDCFGNGVRGDETGRVYAGTCYRGERPYGVPIN